MRFKEKVNIELINHIENHMVRIPPMIVQPILENAIKHGIRELECNGLITIDFRINNETIVITVEDNGIGRSNNHSRTYNNYPSRGLGLIEKRLSLLNEKYNSTHFSLSITDLKQEELKCGTKVEINLGITKGSQVAIHPASFRKT